MTMLSISPVPISIPLKLCLYLVPFLRYLAPKNGVALKPIIYDFVMVGRCKYSSVLYHFYHATRMHSADYAVARCLSVRLSVTSRYSV